jgi:hypothetical protein
MVSATGPGFALVPLLAIPLVWRAPPALICTELACDPEEGGARARHFWAFQAGWWSSLSAIVDTSLHVVLAESSAARASTSS